jgi:UDP:flavonoid glycosyltransferase YjiC (YdhE family)
MERPVAGMRVLFTTSAWSQHYYTMVPLAWAFRSAGHEVAVAAAPNMGDVITRTGLPAVATGPEADLPALNRQTLDRTRHGPPADVPLDGADDVLERWRQLALTGLAEVVGFARQWRPGLVVCDPLAPAGLVAAHVLGVPGFRHLLAVDILGSSHGEALLSVLPGFYEPFQRYGLDIAGDPAAATVDPYPPSLQPPPGPARKPVQYVPYNGTGELARTALPPRNGRPRACITFGNSTTLAGGTRAFPATAALHALLAAGAEAIIAINPRDRPLLPDPLPDHTTILPAPPLHMLLPHCDAIIHQGGTGGILTAARHNLPQLAITYLPETANCAQPLAAQGAGLHLPAEDADEEALAAHVDRLLNDQGLRRAAADLHHEILAQPTPQHIADELVRAAQND